MGAGAAGLMSAAWAGRTLHGADGRVVAVDGARTLGAKILVAGGGRCNVTHDVVDETAYAGSSRNTIRKVLRRFDVAPSIEFFRELGVTLKREETGKLFPTTDSARTVLDALLRAVREAGAGVVHPWRVARVVRTERGFVVKNNSGDELFCRKVILCSGGRSLPKSGSDGAGYEIARSLGHSITARVFPALVPLLLPAGHVLTTLSGLTLPASLEVRGPTGKRLAAFIDSTLLTHFGLSGPSVLDISRYYTEGLLEGAKLVINFLPQAAPAALDESLRGLGRQSVGRHFSSVLPERLVRALCSWAGVEFATPGASLAREARLRLVTAFTEQELPITGDRGWNYAEVTAGGVPLAEIRPETMESRVCPGLHLAGEICDVDGRIGGYNFQWAWASGFVAGSGAAAGL